MSIGSVRALVPTLQTQPLTPEGFAPYGQVIAVPSNPSTSGVSANQGTATRINYVARVDNLRPDSAKANMCVFRSIPRAMPFEMKLIERHLYSTQAFIPMSAESKRYLVIVARNGADDRPDLTTLAAFIATNTQGISYDAGCWHHPMVALDYATDFAVLVHEDNTSDDCHVVDIEPSIMIHTE
ncbi:ureidoglycolate hydrolase [Capsaspora owczarzaki ATCC 30864]|uniref:Ureidoglycolate hydrolase n=1 Tax=Capsaspora owczarzaki (strain ATCC 30864) TaxID=595528 RepID=A0A0D2WX64_CAPO3|nr:ureidoglycolate hydrolase [Capsaspora owczarzaki ATCC 30864]KJE97700.1 ureidoglycolate hydrolase [Capsaspora owczarzaki ATCC 30864]|eukprot:XP_004342877.1 ureidoglycolate hydrolase [Capsaspora owczarzaki ATCC 30864]